MPGFFYNLGRSVRAGAQKAKWVFTSLTGSDEETIRAERQAGVEIARAFEQEAKLDADEDIAALLNEVGSALRKRVKNKLRKFNFKAVDMPEPNAFALPGGFIYITRSLIELCGGTKGASLTPLPLREGQGEGRADQYLLDAHRIDHEKSAPTSTRRAPVDATLPQPLPGREGSRNTSPLTTSLPTPSLRDELAFILGHEMGHVVRGHAMQRMVNSTLVNTASKAVPIGGIVGKVIVQAGSKFLSAAYSQDHELEADAFGQKLARAAGFDEAAGITMMRRLQKLGGDHPEDSLGAYFATHPPFEVRIRHLKKGAPPSSS